MAPATNLPKADPISGASLRPLHVLAASLAVMLFYGLYVLLTQQGGERFFHLYYFAPMAAPFTAFLLDRLERRAQGSALLYALDLLVLAVSIARAFQPVPFVSGHALFLAYALLTVRMPAARALAALVMMQVVYLKLFVWHDATFWGGVAAALLAAGLYWLEKKRNLHAMGCA